MTREEEAQLGELLARCAADDPEAQREFANRSFLNTIHQAVVRTSQGRRAKSAVMASWLVTARSTIG